MAWLLPLFNMNRSSRKKGSYGSLIRALNKKGIEDNSKVIFLNS